MFFVNFYFIENVMFQYRFLVHFKDEITACNKFIYKSVKMVVKNVYVSRFCDALVQNKHECT